MNEYGTVISLDQMRALVRIQRHAACGDCKACAMGVSNLSQLDVDVENKLGAQVGDLVKIEMQTPDVLKAAFYVYTIPLLALLLGIAMGYYLTSRAGAPNEMIMIALGAGMMLASGFFVKRMDQRIKQSTNFEPKMTEVKRAIL